MRTSDWPTYLLWNVPEELKDAIAQEANEERLTLADTMRQILCSRFDMECPPVSEPRRKAAPSRNAHFLLRVSPELFAALQGEAKAQAMSVRQFILSTLSDHYSAKEAA